ncbi:Uncharacterised protein [Mycobacteroides abscessus subsp. abscessus]|nr:Uncharacterised protein [Mycobacteroides abscessus subsp. abscessus]
MGFLKSISLESGLTLESAYHRIDTTFSSDGLCTATLNVYVSRQHFLDGNAFLDQKNTTYPIQYGQNVGSDKDQGYDYLKSTDEYKDAIDVFEDNQPS